MTSDDDLLAFALAEIDPLDDALALRVQRVAHAELEPATGKAATVRLPLRYVIVPALLISAAVVHAGETIDEVASASADGEDEHAP
jgi:hypothetical protein